VVKDRAEQRMGGAGVPPAVIAVQLGHEPYQLAGVHAELLRSGRHAGADMKISIRGQPVGHGGPAAAGQTFAAAREHHFCGGLIH